MHPDTQVDPPKNSSTTNWLIGMLLVLMFAFMVGRLLNHRRSISATKHLGVGNKLSEVDFEPLLNTKTKISLADVQGKPVLINIWGPWCGPCLQEFPELSALEMKHRTKHDVAFLFVSSDGGAGQSKAELAEDTQGVLNRHRSTAAMYFDPQGKVRSAVVTSARLDRFGYPTTLILDQTGVIRAVWTGFDEYAVEEMGSVLNQLLNEQPQ